MTESNVTVTATEAPLSTIARIGEHEGQSVTLHAWLYNLRESGKLLFPIFRDGTGTIQGIVPKAAVPPEVFDTIKTLTQESSVIVTGKVRADKRAPGGYELDVEHIQVLQRVPEDAPYPISLKEHGIDFLMEHRHLWIRTPRQAAILRIRAEIIKAARDFFDDNGFILTDPPILTPAACEGTSTLFPVDYFGDEAYPHAKRPALHREHRARARQGLLLRPHLPRGKIQDPPPPHRVLDGRAGMAFADLDDLMGLGGELHQLHRRSRPHPPRRRAQNHQPRHREAREHQAALPAPPLRRSRRHAQRSPRQRPARASPSSTATTSARPTKPTSPRSSTVP